ncbi:MAG: phosphotransferase [Kofleriaceae bacterium]
MDLESCLPSSLRGAPITQMTSGQSGALVYRVGDAHVLKISDQQRISIVRAAAAAGVAPEVVHVDEARHAVVSAFVRDQGFARLAAMDPPRARALAGECLRRAHALDVPAPRVEPRTMLANMLAATADLVVPAAARAAGETVLALAPPPYDEPDVLSHNDANPTNLVFDGERVLLLDWDAAAINDPYYDAAAIAVFLKLVVCEPTPRFHYDRRLVAATCGTIFLHLARKSGHPGAAEGTAALHELYAEMRAGTLAMSSADARWRMGLALLAESS